MNERIVTDPAVCSGNPVIRGTRIMVKNILGLVAGGYTLERILLTYPELAKDDHRSVAACTRSRTGVRSPGQSGHRG
jgi:uncharacterized protein (DUF433 family)